MTREWVDMTKGGGGKNKEMPILGGCIQAARQP